MRGMFKERYALPVLVVSLLGGLLCGAYFLASSRNELEGQRRPELLVETLSGIPTRLPVPFLQRHVVLLFTPTCPHCLSELRNMSRVVRSIGTVPCLAISLGPRSLTDSVVDRIGIPFPVFMDTDGSVIEAFGVTRVPMLIYVDERDIIRQVRTGSRPFQEDSVLYARFSRSGAPGTPDVGSHEGMGVRLFTEPLPARAARQMHAEDLDHLAPSACPAGGSGSWKGPVGPRSRHGDSGHPDGPRQAAGPFTNHLSSLSKKEELSCVPRS